MIFRTITSRFPDENEIKKMEDYLRETDERTEVEGVESEKLLDIGAKSIEGDFDKDELFKYTTLASILLNLEEKIIKS